MKKFLYGFFITIFSLILTVTLLVGFINFGIDRTVLNPAYYKNVVKKVDIENILSNVLEEMFEDQISEEDKELPEIVADVVREIFTEDEIANIAEDIVKDILFVANDPDIENKVINIDFSDRREELSSKLFIEIRDYTDINYPDDDASDEDIQEYIDEILNSIEFFNDAGFILDFTEIYNDNEIDKVLEIKRLSVFGISGIILLMSVLIIIISKVRKGIKVISINTLVASSLLTLIFIAASIVADKTSMLDNIEGLYEYVPKTSIISVLNYTVIQFGLVPFLTLVGSIIVLVILTLTKKKQEEIKL